MAQALGGYQLLSAERAGTSSGMGYFEATRWAEALNWPTDEEYCNVIQSWEVVLRSRDLTQRCLPGVGSLRHLVIQSGTK
jgi:hypothetical protein